MSKILSSEHIARCYADESRSASRAEAFALLADKEGKPALARLFRVLAEARGVHARRFGHLMRGKIGPTDENLREMVDETERNIEAYGSMIQEIKAENPSGAVRKGFVQSRRTTEEYAEILRSALEGKLPEGEDGFFVCRICGHIHAGSIPDNCPVCGAVPGRFVRVD